ncbi:hypothetical protein LCGC14_2647570 [marine sediment metagenome]|uniref:Uncharacterized protein n=1 Tax=marine sediment metagenome TaxID=412755 RepID=A0A0F9CMV4_9ZZZZ
MTNREMLDKYKELISKAMVTYPITKHDLRYIGSAIEKYMWMDAELKDDDKNKKENK